MTAAPPLRRRSRRRAERASLRVLVVSAVLLDLQFVVGGVAAWPIYRSGAFVVAVTVTNLIFLVVLGALVGVVRGRFTGEAKSLRDSFA